MKKLKVNLKTIDMDEINIDYLGEGLLSGVLKAKNDVRHIESQISRISLSFVPYDYIIDCYDSILNKMAIKNEIIEICKLFKKWYSHLDERRQKIYVAYFVKHDIKACLKIARNTRYYTKYILPMGRSFLGYVKIMSDFDEKTLIKNPYIYNSYVSMLLKHTRLNRK